jgi:hypothetical protein
MPRYKIITNAGYCGTDEEYIEECEDESAAEEFGWEMLTQSISVFVEEIDDEGE